MDSLTTDAAAITAVIGYTAIIQKRLPERFRKYGVFVACGVGVAYALTVRPKAVDLMRNICEGTMIGLGAAGGYSGMRDLKANS